MGDIAGQIETLKATDIPGLNALYQRLFGEKPRAYKKVFLLRQLAHKIQEQALGGLSPAVTTRIQESIRMYDPIHKVAIKTSSGKTTAGRDIRLPVPGSSIIKNYKGKRLEVKVLDNGFEYEGKLYSHLSHIAKAITGAHWNGFTFFGVKNHGRKW
jgi:small nuclear ribonucleoprotein (snRNP)-like protein